MCIYISLTSLALQCSYSNNRLRFAPVPQSSVMCPRKAVSISASELCTEVPSGLEGVLLPHGQTLLKLGSEHRENRAVLLYDKPSSPLGSARDSEKGSTEQVTSLLSDVSLQYIIHLRFCTYVSLVP